MHNFDRGIIKWLPFDALSGYKAAIRRLKNKRLEINQPILSEDQIATLNYNLSEAIRLQKSVTLYYYLQGKIYLQTGYLEKLDYVYKRIKISNRWLSAASIITINM
ncbi:MAG: YolD-like family protein [Acholeplasmataceae bacterium]|jgi:hypothetical protein|nr:YolD-like family protein [Acholeplasmataceae bacterium]